eukprot:GHVS01028863.1.p1 GENE.GHVS01028863.1~~GHVS01028863.1.p1  ORF type:complete len:131 (+),score=16.66 GHVS01028863.1:89-481(+)
MERNPDLPKLKPGGELLSMRALNLCELQCILADQLRSNVRRSTATNMAIQMSYDYCCRFGKVRHRNAVVDIRSSLEREGDLTEYEICMLVNMMPKTAEEAKALIPSLKRLNNARVSKLLDHLDTYRIYGA